MTDIDARIDALTVLRLRHGGSTCKADLAALAETDPELHRQLAQWEQQDAALRALYGPIAEQPVPAEFRAMLIAAEARKYNIPLILMRIAAVVALIGLGAIGEWGAARYNSRHSPEGRQLATEAFRAHTTYAAEISHPVEVPASDTPHLAAWLSKRLGREITPPGFSDFGFRLLGGRVVPSADGTAALMMYEDIQGRRITLYVIKEQGDSDSAFQFAKQNRLQEFWWLDDDIGCAIVADLPRDTLRTIAESAYVQLTQSI